MKKLTILLLALALAGAVLLTGCGGGSKTDYSALQDDVVKGKSVFVTDTDSEVVFFGYDNILCSALFQSGDVYDFVVEAGFTGDVYALAVYDGAIYVSASDGFFRYDLSLFSGSGTASPEVLWEKNLSRYNPFQIYEGKIYFLYGVTLCCLPLDGGTEIGLAEGVVDFEVTSEGIFYSNKDGELHLKSLDLSEDKVVGEIAASNISFGSAGVYYKEGGVLKCCSPDNGDVTVIDTGASLGDRSYPWVKDSTIMYCDDDYNYYLVKDGTESSAGTIMNYPEKYMGYAHGDWVVSQSADYKTLSVISLADGTCESYDLGSELAEELSGISGSSGTQSGSDTESSGQSGTASAADYDMTDGMQTITSSDGTIEYIYFNDFLVVMPNNEKWSMETSEKEVTFYLFSAQQEGYGGRLVSILAYDIDDESYKELPSYHEAGITQNTNVRLIAEYPTDVQWNHDDASQEADYKDLQTYLQKIGAEAVNSPLQTGDSD